MLRYVEDLGLHINMMKEQWNLIKVEQDIEDLDVSDNERELLHLEYDKSLMSSNGQDLVREDDILHDGERVEVLPGWYERGKVVQ